MKMITAIIKPFMFPLIPAPAARRLRGSHLAIGLPAVLSIGIGALFLAAGAAAGDAWACALTYARYGYGTAAGGTLAGLLALRVVSTEGSWKDLFGPACAAAAWAPFAFVGILGVAQFFGAGSAAGLYAGLAVLLWGAAACMAVFYRGRNSGTGTIAGRDVPRIERLSGWVLGCAPGSVADLGDCCSIPV